MSRAASRRDLGEESFVCCRPLHGGAPPARSGVGVFQPRLEPVKVLALKVRVRISYAPERNDELSLGEGIPNKCQFFGIVIGR
jgi:hypothetical protein